jgi:threonine dehydrogenase-like Zn-dependent dehydrogenase
MGSDRHMHQATPLQRQDDQYEQQAVSHGWHDEEIGGHDLCGVIREEGPPGR